MTKIILKLLIPLALIGSLKIDAQSITYGYAFDLGNGADKNTFFEVVSSSASFTFNDDGTKMYVAEYTTDKVYQYSLSNPFDITDPSSISLDGSSFSFGTEEDIARDITFSADGTKFYVVGIDGTDFINQYTLNTAFDLNGVVTHNGSLQSPTEPESITFSPDGFTMFVLNFSHIYQYSLTSSFDITSSTSLDGTFAATSEGTGVRSIVFNPSGTKLFVYNRNEDEINQYSLATPYVVTSGVSFDNVTFDIVDVQDLSEIEFSADGTKMFHLRSSGDDLYQYDLNAGGFTESSANLGALDGSLVIRLDGDTFTNAGGTFEHKSQYAIHNIPSGLSPMLTVAANGETATLTIGGAADDHQDVDDISSLNFTFVDGAFSGGDASAVANSTGADSDISVDFEDNVAGLTYRYQYDLENGATSSNSLSVSSEVSTAISMTFSADGSKVYILDDADDQIEQYTLNAPYDISTTPTFNGAYGPGVITPKAICFNPDGSRLFVASNDRVYQFDLNTAFDLTGVVNSVGDVFISSTGAIRGIAFSEDGNNMFLAFSSSSTVQKLQLNASFDVSFGRSFGTSLDISTEGSFPNEIRFSENGTKLLVLETGTDEVYQYTLNSPFTFDDGVSYDNVSFDVGALENTPEAIAFGNDGTSLFALGISNDEIIEYAINMENFEETTANTGSVDGSMKITLFGDSFVNAGSNLTLGAHYTLPNLPSGLVPTVAVDAGGKEASLTLAGQAENHQSANDVSALQISFLDAAFAALDASLIENSTSTTTQEIQFIDNPFLTYSGSGFTEVSANDGSVNGSILITVSDDVFNNAGGSFTLGVEYTITNLASGLSPALAIAGDGLSAILSISGQSNDHENEDDIAGLIFTFENSAFQSADASKVVKAINGDSERGIDFEDRPLITYGFSTLETEDLNIVANYVGSTPALTSDEFEPTGLTFNGDGTKMYIVGESGDEVNQYSLTDAFDITQGISNDGDPFAISEDSQPKDVTFSDDGQKMFVLGDANNSIYQYSLSNPFDITTGVTYDNVSLNISSQENRPEGFTFGQSGSKLFVIGTDGSGTPNVDEVNQYTLTNPYDISSVASIGSPLIISEDHFPTDLFFTSDGNTMIVIGDGTDVILKYSLSSSFDITSGVTFDGNSYSISSNSSNGEGLFFDTNMETMFILTGTIGGRKVAQYAVGRGGFEERISDNGEVRGLLSLRITGDKFTSQGGTLSTPSDYVITNLPSGLVPSLDVASDGFSAVLTLSGNAANHQEMYNIADLQFDFTDDAFAVVNAANIGNAENANSGFGISFIQGITWDGSVWSNGSGPSGGDDDVIINGDYNIGTDGYFDSRDLTINSGATMTVDGESSLVLQRNLINNGTLVVESGSSLLTYSPNTITGNDITFKRNTRYADGRYSFVGSPVEQDASIIGSDLGTSVYKYNEATAYGTDGINRWEVASADELIPGKGYTQSFQQEITFTGMPNQGTITIDGSYTEDSNDDYEGWVLVSNPYPAAIDVADFLSGNTNTTGTIYIWDDNGSNTQRGTNADYIVANGFMATNTTPAGGQTRYDQIMGSMQGFFVKLNSAADVEIEFREDMRVTGNSDDHFFRETQPQIARVNLTSNDGLFRQTVIGLADDATNTELNRTYDAQAFNATSDDGLFTMKAGRSLSLNGMTNDWEVIQLQVNTSETGIYQISVELEAYDESIFLRDNLTGEVTDLRIETYSFSAQAGISTDRFELISDPSEILGLNTEKVLVYAYNNILHIQQEGEELREYQLFNMKGQKLLTKSVQSKAEVNLSSYAKGIYLVFDGHKTHKIIIE